MVSYLFILWETLLVQQLLLLEMELVNWVEILEKDFYIPMNINGHIPFFINTLDTIMRRVILLTKLPLAAVIFFTLLASIVFC